MKAELIADWRLRIKDRTLITLSVTAIERILEERERLLAALKIEPHCCGLELVKDDYGVIEAAIAFAEEDSGGH